MPRMQPVTLTADEIRAVAAEHCTFLPEGEYHLTKYDDWHAVEAMVRACIALRDLTIAALAAPPVEQQAEPVAWTPGPNVFKDWCSQWFGPDADDDYLAKAVFALPPVAQRFSEPAQPAPQAGAAEPEDEAYPHDWRRIAINAIADHRNLLKECDRLSALVKQHAAAEQPSQDAERWQFVLEHAVSGKAPKDKGFDITYVPVGHNGSEWGRIEIEWRGAKWEHITADGVNAIIDAARAAQAQGESTGGTPHV